MFIVDIQDSPEFRFPQFSVWLEIISNSGGSCQLNTRFLISNVPVLVIIAFISVISPLVIFEG